MKIYVEVLGCVDGRIGDDYGALPPIKFDEREYGNQRIKDNATHQIKIPNNASETLTPSQIIFCYLAYLESRAKIPAQILSVDWAKVDALQAEENALKQEESELVQAQANYIDKTAELNTKKPQRESSLQSLQAQKAELESTLKKLKKEKKPDEAKIQEVQDELESVLGKIQVAQNSLTNINERLEILATLYDITTGEGLIPELQTLIPNHKLAKQQAWYLEYEIPKRKENLAKLKAELEKEQEAEQKEKITQDIESMQKIISEKELQLQEAIDERDLLAPQLQSAREQYTSAKEKLKKLEANPTKTLDELYPSDEEAQGKL